MNPEEFEKLIYTVDQGVALLTLNNPERRNAWGGRVSVEYRWALHHAHTDEKVRVVVLTGGGDDFCVGADSRDLNTIENTGGKYQKSKLELPPYPEGTPEQFRRNHAYPLCISKPVLAAVNGSCAGVGFLVASYADMRFGAEDNKIKSAFARLGLPAEYGLGWLLPKIMGRANALQILLDGDTIDSAEALRLGWLQKVYPAEKLLEETLAYARRLARESSGYAMGCIKRSINLDAEEGFTEAYTRSVEDMNGALSHPDFKEGLRALKQKRATNFLDAE